MRRIVLLFLAAGLAGCPGHLANPARFGDGGARDAAIDLSPAPVTCPDTVRLVLLPRCATSGCHGSDKPAAGLDLESPNHMERLRGQKATGGPGLIIDPAAPEKSALYTKLSDAPPWKDRMPLMSAPLDAQARRCVLEWITPPPIDMGAPDRD